MRDNIDDFIRRPYLLSKRPYPMMALLARVKIAHKLLISSAVLALPILVLLYSVVSGYNEGIRSAKKELEGTRRLEPLRRMAEDVRVHQRLDYLRLKGDLRWEAQRSEAARRIDEVVAGEPAPQLAAPWQQLRTSAPATPAENVVAHQRLAAAVKALVRKVGDSSTLVLDPDLDSYYLVELAVVLLPDTQETIADAAMLANEKALGEPLSQRDLVQFAIYAEVLENSTLPQVQHAVKTSLREDRNFHGVSESLQQNLPGLIRRYQAEVAACVELMRRYRRMPNPSLMAPELAALAVRAFETGSDFRRASIAELSVLLGKRISALRWKPTTAVGSGILALALAWLIVLVIARNITVPLDEVVELASDVAGGRIKEACERLEGRAVRALLASNEARDEACKLVRAIGQMTESLDSLLAERTRAEQTLRESEERYRTTFAKAAAGIAHVGLDGRWLRFNDAVCAITGYSREELVTKTFAEITHPDDIEAQWALGRRMVAGEIPSYSMEKRYIRKNGSLVWANLTVSLLRDSSGAPQHYLGIMEDITERKQAEERFRLAVEAAPNGMVVADEEGKIVLVNSEVERLFGYSRKEIVGEPIELLVPQQLRDPHVRYRQRFNSDPVRGGMKDRVDLYGQRKDGSEFPAEISVNPIKTSQGLWSLTAIVDLTERTRMEAALAAQRHLLETILRQAADAIVATDAQGNLTFVNATARRLAGLDPEGTALEIPPEAWGQAYNPEGRLIPRTQWAGARALRGKATIVAEVRMVRPDGSAYDILVSAAPLLGAGREIVGAVVTYSHITDRKVMEEALLRQHRWDEALTTIGQAVTSLLPLEEVLTRGLEGTLRASGATLGLVRLVDPKTQELVAVTHHGVPPEYLEMAARLPWGTEPLCAVTASGQPLLIRRPEEFAKFSHLCLLAGWTESLACLPLQAGSRTLGTLQLGHSQAEFFSPADLHALLPAASMLAGAVLAEHLRAAAITDAEEKGFLFRELDHRVRNHLAALISLLHLGAEEAKDEAAERLREMADRVARLADVHNLLTGRGMQPVEVRELSEIVAKNVLAALSGEARINWRVTGTSVRVPPSRVTPLALLLNELLTNCAKHAFPGRATATVTIQVGHENDQVTLEVQDDGVGLDPARQTRGLGTTIVHTLATQSLGGTVQSADEGGTRVMVRFPQERETPEGGAA